MENLIIGNLIAFTASGLMIYSGTRKKKDEILYIHSVEKVLATLSNIVLGGITGAITSAIGFVRNLLCYKNKLVTKQKLIIIILMSSLSLYFNNLGIVGILPVIATAIYTLFMDIKDIIKFKILTISTTMLWVVYNFYILAYASIVFQTLQIIANGIAIYKICKEK